LKPSLERESTMPIPTWIRDLLGIRKDIVETEKAMLEIAVLKDERVARELIVRASREDIDRKSVV